MREGVAGVGGSTMVSRLGEGVEVCRSSSPSGGERIPFGLIEHCFDVCKDVEGL